MHAYASYLNWIESQRNHLLQRVKKWAAINTYTFNISGLKQLLDILSDDFQVLGGTASRISLPAKKMLSNDGSFYDQPLGKALQIRKRPEAPIQVLLGGHYDTVFPPSTPFQSVEELQEGILKGPGIADMKGGMAILLTAVEALERSPFASQIGWEILLTPDEEIGSPGSEELYQNAAKRNNIGLLFEPAFSDGAFVSERKGSATYTVLVQGKSAHAGRDFQHGRSAVFALARFINRLNDFQQNQDVTINVADIEGKGPVNIVPPFASCRVNIRSMDVSFLHTALKNLKQIANESQSEGIQFKMIQDSFRLPKPFDQETKALFEAYGNCAADLNIPFSYRSSGGVCDGNTLTGAGLPTLDTAGGIGGGIHTFDEYLILSSLVERSKLAALFLLKLASRELLPDQGTYHA